MQDHDIQFIYSRIGCYCGAGYHWLGTTIREAQLNTCRGSTTGKGQLQLHHQLHIETLGLLLPYGKIDLRLGISQFHDWWYGRSRGRHRLNLTDFGASSVDEAS